MPNEDDIDDGPHGLFVEPEGSWYEVPSRWTVGPGSNMPVGRWGTRIGAKVAAATGVATTAAAHAGVGGLGAAIGAGAAVTALTVGTGGIAVASAAAGMTVLGMGLGVRSAVRTAEHMENIEEIAGKTYPCQRLGATRHHLDHEHIQHNIIPYILLKKRNKFGKKVFAGLGMGMPVALYGLGKMAYKGVKGTLGQRRGFYAYVIARHMITHDCKLCEALVSELFSPHDYEVLRTMNSTDAGGWIALKMKSN